MNYNIADFITRIKNAALAHRKQVVLPYSKVTKAVGEILVKEGFLNECKEEIVEGKKTLQAQIRYEKRNPVFTDIVVISKPSLRIYTRAKALPMRSQRGGTAIVSTSMGVMTATEAVKKGIGGEVLLTLW